MEQVNEWARLITPENVELGLMLLGALAAGVLALLGKKGLSELVWSRVKAELKTGALATDITDKTTVTLATVDKVNKELHLESQPGDTNKKKAQRAFRKIFRGLILRY